MCKREKETREKGKSVEKSRGKYKEGGSPLKDGVKMEGEKCGKGKPHVIRLSFSLSLISFFHSFSFRRSDGNTPTRWKISKFCRWHP